MFCMNFQLLIGKAIKMDRQTCTFSTPYWKSDQNGPSKGPFGGPDDDDDDNDADDDDDDDDDDAMVL